MVRLVWRRVEEREVEKRREEEKRAGRNGRTCDSMRFTAALRRFIAPSKHKMPGREACIRVGTPPLHFYRRLPVKPGNIPPISCSREHSHPAISRTLSLFPLTLPQIRSLAPSCRFFFIFPLEAHAFLDITNFIRHFAASLVSKSSLSAITVGPPKHAFR